MNRFYITIPAILVLLFGGVYYRHAAAGRAVLEASRAAGILAQKRADEARHALDLQAQADAAQRLATQRTDEQKKEDDRRARWEADTVRLVADQSAAEAKAAALAADTARVQQELTTLRAAKDRLNAETFALEKSVESALIAKRTAEMEIQRLTAVLARQAATLTPH